MGAGGQKKNRSTFGDITNAGGAHPGKQVCPSFFFLVLFSNFPLLSTRFEKERGSSLLAHARFLSPDTPPLPSPPLQDAQRYLAHSRRAISSSSSTQGPRCRRAAAAETAPMVRQLRRRRRRAAPIRSSRSSRRAPSSTPSTRETSETPWRASSTSRTSWRACTSLR